MKKIPYLIALSLLIFILSGCSVREAVSMERQEYLVSALGIDVRGSQFILSVESLVVNSEDTQEDKKRIVLCGEGADLNTAIKNAKKTATMDLNFSHCGVIAISDRLSAEQISQALEFCYQKSQINLSALFVLTRNSRQLLEGEPVSSVSVGYDIMSMLQGRKEQNYRNKFYQILDGDAKIPYLETDQSGRYIDSTREVNEFENYADFL